MKVKIAKVRCHYRFSIVLKNTLVSRSSVSLRHSTATFANIVPFFLTQTATLAQEGNHFVFMWNESIINFFSTQFDTGQFLNSNRRQGLSRLILRFVTKWSTEWWLTLNGCYLVQMNRCLLSSSCKTQLHDFSKDWKSRSGINGYLKCLPWNTNIDTAISTSFCRNATNSIWTIFMIF